MNKPIGMTGILLWALAVSSAWPGSRAQSGQLTVSPYLDLNGVHDSNVRHTAEQAEADFYLDSTLGVRAGYTAFNLDGRALAFISARSYASATNLDYTVGGERLNLKLGDRDRLVTELSQSYRRLQDSEVDGSQQADGSIASDSVLDASARSRRDVSEVSAALGKDVTDKMEVDGWYRFTSLSYVDHWLMDITEHAVQVETAYRATDKSAMVLTMKGGQQEGDRDDVAAQAYVVRLGMKTRSTDKIGLKGGVGVQSFDRSGRAAEAMSLSYDGTAQWAATDKIMLQTGARNGTQLSSVYVDNGTDYQTLWLGGSYRFTPAMAVVANTIYRKDDYLDPVIVEGQEVNRHDEGVTVRLHADYLAPARFLRVYAELSYQTVDSTVQGYDETMAGLGMELRY